MDGRLYEHHTRVIEWMLNGHSTLRDRYARRARGLTLTIIVLSIVGLTLSLANGDQRVSLLGLHAKLQVFLAWLTAVIFLIALLDLIVDWRRRQWAHTDSASRLAELSILYRRARQDTSGDWSVDDVDLDLALEYERVMRTLEPFPSNKAATLKSASNRKRAVFTLVDERPGIPVWWAKVLVTSRAVFSAGSIPGNTAQADDETRADTNARAL